ncbi:helix-turn-helix domain-containing protein [Mycobacterium syngnathidarum]
MSVDGPKTAVPQEYSDVSIDTDEASRILGCSTRHVRRRASDLDGIRIGGRWIFQRRTVVEYAEEKGNAYDCTETTSPRSA